MLDVHDLTVHQARHLFDHGEIDARALVQAVLDRVVAVENTVRAFLAIDDQGALEQARVADGRIRAGQAGPLTGIPIAVKDILCTRSLTTTAGSLLLEDFCPPYDATAVARLRQAGAVIMGKTNLDEFAMGSSTENSAFFSTRNPWDPTRVPGGSSGGSAAAVAAGEALAALGSDTGGSVRQPAAFCGIVGFKPSYGRVSRYGLIAYASSLDQVGCFTRDVLDAALLFEVMAGHDPRDSTTLDAEVPAIAQTLPGLQDLRSMRIGIPREYFVEGMEAGVEQAVRAAIAVLQDLGAELREITLPHTRYALPVYYLIAPAEASSNLARYDGVRYGVRASADDLWRTLEHTRGQGFGPEVRRRILLGTFALAAGYYDAYYRHAQRVRTLVRADFDASFRQVDLLAAPTSPTVAFGLGERLDDPLAMYLSDVLTIPASLAGLPALSVPCGFSEGLPVGLQFIGPALAEPTVLRAGYAYLEATGWHKRRPPLRNALGSAR